MDRLVVVLAVALQLATAILAVRLIWLTGRKWAWGLIALAIFLMAVRRAAPLVHVLLGDATYRIDLPFELLGLAVSICMFTGMAGIGPVFRAFQRNAESVRASQRKTEYLNAVLRAIGDINQLIAREKDQGRLLPGICNCLIAASHYRHAWIALLDDKRQLVPVATASAGKPRPFPRAQLESGEGPGDTAAILAGPGVSVFGVEDSSDSGRSKTVGDGDTQVMAVRLSYHDQVYGVMAACLPREMAPDPEELALLAEAASDISFALHSLRLEAERKRTEAQLRLDESRLAALLRLNQMTDASLQQLTDFALEQAVQLTGSKIGYLAFLTEDESVLTMHSWSKTAMAQCAIIDKPIVYPVETTGLWGEAVRQRKPVITNDYTAPNPCKKGYPAGHVHVLRHMNAPVFDGDRIVIVAGVGNKEQPYDESDVRQLQLLMQGMWQILQRRRVLEQIRQEQARLQDIIEFLPDAMFVVDQDKRVIAWNHALEEMTGVPKEQLIGRGDYAYAEPFYGERRPILIDLIEAEHPEWASKYRYVERRNTAVFAERFVQSLYGGRGAHLWIAAAPLLAKDGQRYGALEVIRDVTDRRRAEEALQKAHDELEARVAERTADLAKSNAELIRARDAAEAASRAKSTFLANMSHEIRTPLTGVIGMTELVLKSPLAPQQRDFLTTVLDSGEGLLSVINDILDFSKIEAHKLQLELRPFNLWESLGDTMKSFALRAHQRGLELACYIHPEVPHLVVGDYGRLRQVVANLVSNAIKFTERGEVVVEVCRESATESDVVLQFTVTDTGEGIPETKQGAIFEMFEQADTSTTRRHGGTGLGLAIARRLTEIMGGRISLESTVGSGSRFQFTVRLKLAEPLPAKPVAREPACLHGLKVLVVDDNGTNRRIFEEILYSWQLAPTTARSAAEALDLLQAAHAEGQPYRLLLTDAHMPRIDGFMLAEQIKQKPELRDSVIIMLTSGDRPDDAERCQQLGLAGYLLKPVKQSELLEAIERALGVTVAKEPVIEVDKPCAAGPLQILLAEDSMVNQKLAVAVLQSHGHTVTIANNGREAVTLAKSRSFDLVLMDIQMPEMDGLEATGEIRRAEEHTARHLPIIAMTAHALAGDRERCLAAGMDGYVSKPIRARDLFAEIDRLATPAKPASAPAPVPPAEPAGSSPAGTTVDWSGLLAMVQGDRDIVREMVQAALVEIPQRMSEIREAREHGNYRLRERAAHSLKSLMANFGVMSVSEHARQLEALGREARLEDAAPLVALLEQESRDVQAAFEHFLQQPAPGPGSGERGS